MKTSLLCSILFLLAACPGSPPNTTTVEQPGGGGTGTGTGTGTSEDPPRPGPMHGEDCGPADSCAEGLECVSYYGIAGPSGPEFKSCEQRCDKGGGCPEGLTCNTIADGPGEVCRP